jgi:nitroreductase
MGPSWSRRWLAAENLMLAAHAMGLGTCVIGSAVPALNTPKSKAELNIPSECTAIADHRRRAERPRADLASK